MQNSISQHNSPSLPFINIVHDAQDIMIQEMNPEHTDDAIRKIKEALTHHTGNERTFFVSIKPKTPIELDEVKKIDLSQWSATKDAPYLLDCAEILLSHQDYVLAQNIFSYVLKSNVKDTRGLRGLGICFLNLGEIESAKKCFKAMTVLGMNDTALYLLAECKSARHDHHGALELLSRVHFGNIRNLEDKFGFQKLLGNCYTHSNQLPLAYIAYQKASEINPHSDTLLVNLGTLELQNSNPKIAEQYFQRALEINPSNSKAHSGMGLLALAQKQRTTAQTFFEEALESDISNKVALFNLVKIAHEIENAQIAYPYLYSYLEKHPKDTLVRFHLSTLLFANGEWTQCETHLLHILKVDADFEKAIELLDDLNRARR